MAMYLPIWGASVKATMPEMPAPSSMAMLEGHKKPHWERKFGEEIHAAKRGVTFQTTATNVSEEGYGDDGEIVQTCACGALLAVRREEATRLPDGEVSPTNADLDLGCLGIDEAQRLRRKFLREDDKGFWRWGPVVSMGTCSEWGV